MPSIALPVSLRGQLLSAARAFSPASLFASAEPGIWLDPSDLTTMFQDRAGTTPVTTPGQTVGLRLDKSKGLTLRSELRALGSISTVGAPAFVATYSTVTGAGTSYRTDASNTSGVLLNVPDTDGLTFLIDLEVSTGTVQIRTDGPLGAVLATISVGRTTLRLSNPTANTICLCSGTNGAGNTFILHSIRELAGNHAVAPTDAARPTYGIEPKTGRRNLLLATDVMATQSRTVTAVAHTLSFTGTGTVTLTGASIAGPLIGTGAEDRVSLTFTPTAGSLTLTVVGSVTLAQLEIGLNSTNYQRVGTAFDVTEAGVPTCHYVQYDGTDDSFSTSSIDFTATDKMSVFAGVRKLSDAAQGVLAELSATIVSNNGSFLLAAPDGATATFGFDSKGTTQVDAVASSLTSPVSRIVTGLADISGDKATIRINSVQVDQDTGDQGTGNFGSYPLYIGRRNNASLPFNGRDYGIIVVGKAASGTEITATETYLASKTSEVTL